MSFEKSIFRLNILVTTAVFVLLIPTTRILSEEYYQSKAVLWMYPLFIGGISALVWLFWSMGKPLWIRWGLLEDRRSRPRPKSRLAIKVLRISAPILVFLIHLAFVVFFCILLIKFMRSGTIPDFLESLKNIP